MTVWYDLGLALGLSSSTLAVIKNDENNTKTCLREMLRICLDTISLTWSDLCEGLEEKSVRQNFLAGEIKEWICTNRKRSRNSIGDSVASDDSGDSVASDDSDGYEKGIYNYSYLHSSQNNRN